MNSRTRCVTAILFALILSSCSGLGPFKPEEVKKIADSGQTIVLLRFAGEADGQPVTMFHSILPDDGPGMAIANFETGGEIDRRVEPLRYFSEEALRDGWVLLVLPSGTHYMAVQPRRLGNIFTYMARFKHAPRWRIDVPQGIRAMYAGTLFVKGIAGTFIGGEKYLKTYYLDSTEVRNDETLAAKLFATHMPELGAPFTSLMERHLAGPVIIRTPAGGSGKK